MASDTVPPAERHEQGQASTQFTALGAAAVTDMSEAAFGKFIADEQKKWADVVVRSGAVNN